MTTIYKTSVQSDVLHLVKLLGVTPQDHRLDGFAEACYNDNTITELVEALKLRAADATDCKNWGITPTQWRNAITQALESRLARVHEFVQN